MIIETTNSLDKFLRWAELQSEFYVDIETTGLRQRHDVIIGIAVYSGNTGFYLAHKQFKKYLTGDGWVEELQDLLTQKQLAYAMEKLKGNRLITFNGAFDLPFIKHYLGVDLLEDLWLDALLLKHTVDEEFPFRLKDIGKKLFGVDAAKEQEEMKESIKANGGSGPGEMYKCDLPIMAKYAIKDTKLTKDITEYYLPKLKQQGLEEFFFEQEVMPLYKEVTIPMEQGGIPVDVEALKASLQEINSDIELLENEIQESIEIYLDDFKTWYANRHYPIKRTGDFGQAVVEFYGMNLPKTKAGKYSLAAKALETVEDSPGKKFLTGEEPLPLRDAYKIQDMLVKAENKYSFNLSSKHNLKKLFFEALGEKAVSFTEKGNPQVDDTFLELMADKYEWAARLRDYNKLVKIRGAYVERFLNEQEDGVFYPSFFQHRTVSGRYGSDLQQLPRPLEAGQASKIVIKHTNRIRKYFIAGEGHVFIDSDYESLEPHVFAHVSGDERLRNIFRSGDDFYSTIAIQTEKISNVSATKTSENYLGKVDKLRRQKAKAYSLGIPYGMTAYKLQFEIDVEQHVAEQLINQYLDAFPDLKQWMQNSVEQVITYGAVRSEAGRIRHMPEAKRLNADYGLDLSNALWVWKQFNENPAMYEAVKKKRKRFVNYLNNARNFQIQSLATSIVNRAAIAIMRYMKSKDIPGYVCAQIHDQLIVRIPEEHAHRMQEAMQEIMETNYKLSVPLKAPASLAKDFYEGH